MSDLKQKFIIGPDGFEMGRVIFHKQLDPKAKGGGFWFFDEERNVVYLYSDSFDFGPCNQQMIDDHMDEIKERFIGATVKFESYAYLGLYEVLRKDMDFERASDLITGNDFV